MANDHNWIELPSISEIDEIEKQRQKAIDSLEIFDNQVKCQGCQELKAIIKDDSMLISAANSRRIAYLKSTIKQIERFHIPARGYPNHVAKKEREELANLLKEEEQQKRDIVRRLPLYSSKISGYRFLCSKCYDECERIEREREKEKRIT